MAGADDREAERQAERARALRRLIGGGPSAPKSPREQTDTAAVEAAEAATKRTRE